LLGRSDWLADLRFISLDARLEHQEALDALVQTAVAGLDVYELMEGLQQAGVPAGVCQTAQDRCERDPQLRYEGWQIELPQTDMGLWPVKEFPVRLERTPAQSGGRIGRAGPNYGEDTELVLGMICGMPPEEVAALRQEGAL
jgi:crotonobetainyl-CoA:carnitine CoA-transferase CaiB-like acyl-CoA transferase